MGKARIEEALGEGLYRVSIDSGEEYRDQMVIAIAEAIAKLEPVREELQAAVSAADAKRKSIIAEIDHLIGIYRQAVSNQVPSDQMNPIRDGLTNLATEMADATRVRQIAALSLLDVDTIMAEATQRSDELEQLELVEQLEAWCCDYTDDATPEILAATMEVPGEPQQIILAPGVQPWSSEHGQLMKKDLMAGHQAFFNVAILPGWQRFRPTYRIGTITEIYGDDTVNVELEGTSTAQNLDIGPLGAVGEAPAGSLWNVPVDYMDAGVSVFDVGDRVVVLLENYDWAQPRVIGFEKEPRPVVGLLCHPSGNSRYQVFRGKNSDGASWRASPAPNPGTVNINYGRLGWTDGRTAVSWTNNKSNRFHRIFYRGRSADIVEMFPSLYYYEANNNYVMPWIMGAVARGDHVVVLAYTYQPERAGLIHEQLSVALPLRRIDVLSIRLNRSTGPFWLDITVQKSIALPTMPYRSLSRAADSDPNPAVYLYGRCQGFSISPLGKTILFFYDSLIYRFDFGVSEDGLVVQESTQEQSGPPVSILYEDYNGIVPGYTYSSTERRTVSLSGEWAVGATWVADRAQEELKEFIIYKAEWLYRRINITGQNIYDEDGPGYFTQEYYRNVSDVTSANFSISIGSERVDLHRNESSEVFQIVTITRFEPSGPWEISEEYIGDRHHRIDEESTYIYHHVNPDAGVLVSSRQFRDAPGSYTYEPMTIKADGKILYSADTEFLHYPHPTFMGPSWPSQGVATGISDPLMLNNMADYFFLESRGQHGRIMGDNFVSIDFGDSVFNYATGNPTLTGVFPADSGVDLTASFAPVVPFNRRPT